MKLPFLAKFPFVDNIIDNYYCLYFGKMLSVLTFLSLLTYLSIFLDPGYNSRFCFLIMDLFLNSPYTLP